MSDEATFMFADLAGFTALTEAHGDEPAADLVEEFSALVREQLPRHRAEQIKLIGDAIMLRVPRAGDAIRLALEIVGEVGMRHGSPAVRVGMHTGPAVWRGGDWFGTTVNLAARVAGTAGGGEVLLTDATRRAAGSLGRVRLEPQGRRQFKNLSRPIALYAAEAETPSPKRQWPIDPVCRMAVEPDRRAGVLTHAGREYSFCSMKCVSAFASEPERYARTEST